MKVIFWLLGSIVGIFLFGLILKILLDSINKTAKELGVNKK